MSDGGGGDGGGGSASGGGVLARLLAALWGDPSSSGQQQAAEFRREFESSYGGVHPDFFAGDFKGAWGAAHAQYRFLALYLHSASHQDHVGAAKHITIIYLRGQGVARDNSRAKAAFTVAAEAGDADCQFFLAAFYYDVKGVDVDYKQSVT